MRVFVLLRVTSHKVSGNNVADMEVHNKAHACTSLVNACLNTQCLSSNSRQQCATYYTISEWLCTCQCINRVRRLDYDRWRR